jgi:hypothetical protein
MPIKTNCVTCGAVHYELIPTDEPECIACTERRDPEEANRMKQEHVDFLCAAHGLPKELARPSSERRYSLN